MGDSKVKVEMTDAVNAMLHISFNGMKNSEVEVMMDKTYNTTVHVSFQNPVNTPVKVMMDNAKQSFLHVSQNIPGNSPMEVTMKQPMNSQIHVSQAVPMSSPLTWKLDGDPSVNQVHVSQNSADDNSALDCSPACPQKEGGEVNGGSGAPAQKSSNGSRRKQAPSQR